MLTVLRVHSLNLDDLAMFVRVIDERSFVGAARELGTPTSTVSRAVARLEARAGVRLLQRTTRQVRPTSEGQELYASVAPALSQLRVTAQSLGRGTKQARGRLRVTAPGDLCSGFLSDLLVAFAERYPQIQLDFSVTNKRVNLIEEDFDVALRASPKLVDSSLVVRKLGELNLCLYASPRYLERRGIPAQPEQLAEHACVLFRAQEMQRIWLLEGPEGQSSVALRAQIAGDDMSFVRAMLVAGAGIGLLSQLNCVADVVAGRLVRVLPSHHVSGAAFHIVYPSRNHLPGRVTVFRDFVTEAFAAWALRASGEMPSGGGLKTLR